MGRASRIVLSPALGRGKRSVTLLTGFRVVQLGPGLAAAVCGRLFADVGATVACVAVDRGTPLAAYLNHGKPDGAAGALAAADLIIAEGGPATLLSRGHDLAALRRVNATAALVLISPFGQTGPRADEPATDLTLFAASGIARLLTGQVDDLTESPIRPVGEQSAFIGGIAAACAGMQAALARDPAVVDVSIQEALATLAMTELARAGLHGRSWSRKRVADGNGATVCILPARDGYAAISPREDRQWAAWLGAMGSPDWGSDPRFARKADRVANWDALHALMSEWSRQQTKQEIADLAQAARVPCFPLRELEEQFESAQLAHRGFWRTMEIDSKPVRTPGPPFGLTLTPGKRRTLARDPLPLSGVRVLDFSWVIAGPTTTRYLAAMGADVIKVEAPGAGDPGRASELHTVLGQGKRGIVLDLKRPEATAAARALAAQSDVLVENFAGGVMDRLGLGAAALREINPNLIYVSASGLGRTGPESQAVAYGTLLQCYAGFAGLNRHPNIPPRVGMAWLDPMCGLMLAFITAAALWRRAQDGSVARVDFSMIEAMLWTLAKPLLATQQDAPPRPRGNASDGFVPHGIYKCAGDDAWLSMSVASDMEWRALCAIVPALRDKAVWTQQMRAAGREEIDAAVTEWTASQSARTAAETLSRAGIAAADVATSVDLVHSAHLRARGFWDAHGDGVLPGLPWHASFGRVTGLAPGLGEHTNEVLRDIQ